MDEFGGELGLADSPETGGGGELHLPDRGGLPSPQLAGQGPELFLAAHEEGIVGERHPRSLGQRTDLRQLGLGQVRDPQREWRRLAGKRRLGERLRPLFPGGGQEGAPGSLSGQADQIGVDDPRQQSGHLDLADTDGQQLFLLGQGGRPFHLPEVRAQVLGREDRDRALGLRGRLVHLGDEIGACPEIPGLILRGESRGLQHPGDPHGPVAVGLGVAEEEVGHGGRCLVEKESIA